MSGKRFVLPAGRRECSCCMVQVGQSVLVNGERSVVRLCARCARVNKKNRPLLTSLGCGRRLIRDGVREAEHIRATEVRA